MTQDLLPDRLEISWGRGWLVYDVACPMCGHEMAVVAAIGSAPGINCTRCEYSDPDFDWHGVEGEMANDGAWLAPIYNPILAVDLSGVEWESAPWGDGMTKVFFDCEFTGLHQHTTLISIGCVAESGEMFYAECTDFDRAQIDEWLTKNVIANLWQNNDEEWTGNQGVDFYEGPTPYIADKLRQWLSQFEQVELWADVLAYDWVLFCELFGGALGIPDNVYYIPMDVATWLRTLGHDPDANREELAGIDDQAQKHNALHDAWVLSQIVREVA